MKIYGQSALFAALVLPGVALAQISEGDTLGKSEATIRSALESQGYAVTDFEIEDGEIEVEAMYEGKAYEFEVSPETGIVLEIELDDDDTEDS